MDFSTIKAAAEAFHQAHPVYYTTGVFVAGIFFPKIIALGEKAGIPWLVKRARARQRAILSQVMTPTELAALEAREAADMRAAADELEKPDTSSQGS